jgi:hypothetical protein
VTDAADTAGPVAGARGLDSAHGHSVVRGLS